MTRVLIIGGGIAGYCAALAARRNRADVTVVTRAPGATALYAGGMEIVDDLDAVLRSPHHPLARLGLDPVGIAAELDAAISALQLALGKEGLKFDGGWRRRGLYADIHGLARPANLVPDSVAPGELGALSGKRVAVIGVPQIGDYDAGSTAQALKELHGIDAFAEDVSIPDLPQAAALTDLYGRRAPSPRARGAAIAYPPGFANLPPDGFELLASPPSPHGWRLQQAIALGAVNAEIVSFETARGEVSSARAANRTFHADAFVLATGRHIGGGLRGGRVTVEPLLGLGVFDDGVSTHKVSARLRHLEYLEAAAEMRLGLMTDRRLHPLDESGQVPYANLYAAGAVLGGYDYAGPCGFGVPILTGWLAGQYASEDARMRLDMEKIVGAAAVDDRPVRDLWPLAIIDERAGKARGSVLVVRPSNRQQLSEILRWAAARHVAVSPLGGGSGVCGALGPLEGELAVDMGAFDRIFEIDETNLICKCEAGVNGWKLESELNARGLTLGHYPSSLPGTTVGGLVSTRSSGQESSRYGSIENMVISLAVVLPDGTFAAPRPGPRSAVGPALHELFLGAEGGLGIVIGAALRVHRLPEATFGRGYAFVDLRSGLECMRSMIQAGIRPLVMRLYDHEDAAFNGYDVNDQECVLIVATAGPRDVASAEAAEVKSWAKGSRELGDEPWARWQKHRFDLSAERLKMLLAPPGSFLDTIELAGPWTVLAELHARVKTAIAVGGFALCHFSHAYEQGCCAYFSFGGSSDSEGEARAAYGRAWEGAMSAALELGATISHHHGVGQVRAKWVADELGGWMRVWRAVKDGLDPEGIMNPRALGGAS